MSSLTDIQNRIDIETADCVNKKKTGFESIFRSRKYFEPACRLEVSARYQNELNALAIANQEMENALNQKTLQTLNTTNNIWFSIGIILAVATLIYLTIFYQ